MAKWINRDTDEIGTFGEEKRGNKSKDERCVAYFYYC